MDRVDVDLVDQLRITLCRAEIQVQRTHCLRIRHRLRTPKCSRLVIDGLSRVPVLDVLGNDVAQSILVSLKSLHSISTVIDIPADQSLPQAN